jgi:predicted  nucleic acid-binding Zn-ribbon protein
MVAVVPDDDRTRRRLGDETKGRIADLASGWTVEPEPAPDTPKPPDAKVNAPRQKPKTLPPPPPGSHARKALEDSIVDSRDTPIPIASPRTKPPSAPPPARDKVGSRSGPTSTVGARTGPTSTTPGKPAFGAKSGPTDTGTVARVGVIGATGSVDKSAATGVPKSTGAKSGPTETGTVARSGVIGATGPIALASGPSSVANSDKVTRSGAIAIGDRSGAIIDSAPIKRSGPVATRSTGSTPALPARSASRTTPPPPPTAKPGVKATDRLPLRADPTDNSAAPSAVPPPLPPAATSRPHRPRAALVDESLETVTEDQPGAMPKLAVPVGEFDSTGNTDLEQDKLRIAYEQSTQKRDAANALLGVAEQPETIVKAPPVETLLNETAQQLLRGDETTIDVPDETVKFERGDPTLGPGDATIASLPSHGGMGGGTLRAGAALRRKRGAGGDLKYVATVLMGVRRTRRELETLEKRQELRKQSRRRHLVTLGRAAATLDNFDHPALGPARELLAGVEDERSKHAGAVTAADTELARVHRDRDAKAKQYLEDIVALDTELAQIAKKLEPLEKECAVVAKRASELRDSLRRIDAQIAATEASQHSVKKGRAELGGIHAEIATLKADRIAVQRDEPKLAAELDALNPRIAALEARQGEARKRRIELEQAELDDQRRGEELLAAIGAKRKVVDRAAGDAETLRDKILFELGERLYVDRPSDLSAQLAPIDVIDVELGTGERRSMELREILSSIDKAKLARGIALAILIASGAGGLVTLLLYAAL